MLQSLLPPPPSFPMKLYEGELLDTLLPSPSILAQMTILTFSSLRQSSHLNEGKTVAMLTPSFMTRTFSCVHANTMYIHSNAYRKGEPNLTSEMFCRWVNDNYGVNISCMTARRWLHYLGFNTCDHQKGVYFDGHEREDVIAYHKDLLVKLSAFDETMITPSHPSPNPADGEKKHIRIVHDESTFFSNADQTRFWNDGESQVLRQKSLGSSIMVFDLIYSGRTWLSP